MAITTFLSYAVASGGHIANRSAGTFLKFVCDTEGELPSVNVIDGDRAYTNDTNKRWIRTGGAWVEATEEVDVTWANVTGKPAFAPSNAQKNSDITKAEIEAKLTGEIASHTHAGGPGGEAFPVGSVFIAVVATNPATLLGYGTWSAFAAGRVLVGLDAGQTEFDTVEETGGAKTHTLTTTEIPAHTHVQDAHSHVITSQTATTGGATSYEHGTLDTSSAEAEATETTATTVATNQNTGGGGAHNNLQPYIVVHLWKRTA